LARPPARGRPTHVPGEPPRLGSGSPVRRTRGGPASPSTRRGARATSWTSRRAPAWASRSTAPCSSATARERARAHATPRRAQALRRRGGHRRARAAGGAGTLAVDPSHRVAGVPRRRHGGRLVRPPPGPPARDAPRLLVDGLLLLRARPLALLVQPSRGRATARRLRAR